MSLNSKAKGRHKKSIDQVFEEVAEELPHLVEYLRLDRSWVWLANPVPPDRADRKALFKIGFRCKKGEGHALPDGEKGHWGHACEKPVFRKKRPDSQASSSPIEETADPFAGLAAMGF